MDVSKYKSVGEWRDDFNARGWNINITAGWALSRTMEVLGLSFQAALDFLLQNKKLIFVDQTSFTDLNFQTLLDETLAVKKIFDLPPRSPGKPRTVDKNPHDPFNDLFKYHVWNLVEWTKKITRRGKEAEEKLPKKSKIYFLNPRTATKEDRTRFVAQIKKDAQEQSRKASPNP